MTNMINDVERDEERGIVGSQDIPSNLSRAEYMKMCAAARIPVTSSMTKEDLITALNNKNKKVNQAPVARGDQPAPGRVRIKIFRDPTPGASNFPVYVSVNGFRCNIPRGIAVDVPFKIVEALDNAKQMLMKENIQEPVNSPKRYQWEEELSYPYQELARTEGPDPKPGMEVQRRAKTIMRESYVEKFGSWPTDQELKDAIKNGDLKEARAQLGKS